MTLPRINIVQARNLSLALGGAALAVSLFGLLGNPVRFYGSYLEGYLLWVGMPLGCALIIMLHNLVGGAWGVPLAPVLRAAAATVPLMALLFLPVLAGMGALYPWLDAERVAEVPELQHKTWYLNREFFLLRAALFFLLWWAFTRRLRGLDVPAARVRGTPERRRLQRWSAAGFLVFTATLNFAAIDWIMSLEPLFFSSIFGLIIGIGSWLGAMALAISLALLFPTELTDMHWTPRLRRDLGNLLLMSVMLWAYFSYSQYFIVWMGELKEEVVYYNHRFLGGWGVVATLMLLAAFLLPFPLLLSRTLKENPRWLLLICALILLSRWVEALWQVMPNLSPMRLTVHWLDFLLPAGIGGVWLGACLYRMERGK